jgi:membrane protease YdiL (CAAX protease family)
MTDSESQPSPEPQVFQNSLTPPAAPNRVKSGLIAPVWHTVVITGLILLNSYGGLSSGMSAASSGRGRLLLYAVTLLVQTALVLFIWFGIARKGVRMRDLSGGRWARQKDFLLDVAIAAGFWLISTVLRSVLAIAFHLVDIRNPQAQMNQMKHALGPVAPRSGLELTFFLVLVIFAGAFEEIIFRGYLQRQFGALAGNTWIGVIVSAVVFGAAHGYQGARLMVVIGMYGAMFGVLAVLRQSLRPGMITHAGQDAFSGIAYFLMVKNGIL